MFLLWRGIFLTIALTVKMTESHIQNKRFKAADKVRREGQKNMEEYSIHLPEDCGINISTTDSYYENNYGVLNDSDLSSLFDDPTEEDEEDEE